MKLVEALGTFLENAFCTVCTMMEVDIAFRIEIRYSDICSLSIAIPQVKGLLILVICKPAG